MKTGGQNCKICGEWKDWKCYWRNPGTKTGYAYKCRACIGPSVNTVKRQIDDGGRECVKCGEYKPWELYSSGSGSRGKRTYCKPCDSQRYKDHKTLHDQYSKNPPWKARIDDGGRECRECREYLPWSNFRKALKQAKGHDTLCKPCRVIHDQPANELAKLRRRANPEKHREYNRNYCRENKEKVSRMRAKWRAKNKKRYLANVREWQKANPEKVREYIMSYRHRRAGAEPIWISEEHRLEMVAIQSLKSALNEETGIAHSVDHQVPLCGMAGGTVWSAGAIRVVCGLHVPWNLEVVTVSENSAKSGHWNASLPVFQPDPDPHMPAYSQEDVEELRVLAAEYAPECLGQDEDAA